MTIKFVDFATDLLIKDKPSSPRRFLDNNKCELLPLSTIKPIILDDSTPNDYSFNLIFLSTHLTRQYSINFDFEFS